MLVCGNLSIQCWGHIMSIQYGPRKIINAAAADASHRSDDSGDSKCLGRSCDIGLYSLASVQLIWSGLTGTINGTLTIECSDDNINWDTKNNGVTPCVITVSGAAGNDVLTISEVSEKYYRAKWDNVGVTGGLVTAILTAKD